MSKLSKSTRAIVIAAAVLLVLGVVFMVLMLTEPKGEESSAVSDSGTSTSQTSSEVDKSLILTDKEGTDILSAKITNELGSYTFKRDKRVVSTTDSDGNVTSSDQYFWVSEEMAGLKHNDTTIKAFMNCLAGLTASEMVEENAEDLAKYGLETPVAKAEIAFEDGTSAELLFGIQNPAATNNVYCRMGDSRNVLMVSFYSVGDAYEPVTNFVNLTLTEGYNANSPKELDYLIIERKDLDEPVEMSYMYDIQEEAQDIDSVITTFNSHRITSPLVAEVDSTKGQTICYGLYGLSAAYCVSVDSDEELLEQTGLDDPYCKVTFKYGGQRRVLLLGDQIITETQTEDEETPTLTTVAGYFGMMEGSDAVYAFTTDSAPWYTFSLQDIVSRRPVSPYIYTVDTLTITTPDKEYLFKVNGDAKENSFVYGELELDGDKFRALYQQLISAVGDELFLTEGDYEPYISVRFDYRSEYEEVYGTDHDVLEFYRSDDRKNIVRVNGKVLFKVRQVYTERLLENLDALITGGEIRLDW